MLQTTACLQPALLQLGRPATSQQQTLRAPCRLPLQQRSNGRLARRSAQQQRQQQRRGRSTAPAAAVLLPPTSVFDAATVFVLPFYAAMIAAPGKRFTQRLFSTPALFIVAAALYGLLLLTWNPLPALGAVAAAAADAVQGVAAAGGTVNAWRAAMPSMPAFAALFGAGEVTALAWVHLVLLDLFQARWVFQDGTRSSVPIWHSAVLCFMTGPLGLLCHLVTKAAVLRWRARGGRSDEFVLYRF